MASVLETLAKGFEDQRSMFQRMQEDSFFDKAAPQPTGSPLPLPSPQATDSQPMQAAPAATPIIPNLFATPPQTPVAQQPDQTPAAQGPQTAPQPPQVGPSPEVQNQASALLAALMGGGGFLQGANQGLGLNLDLSGIGGRASPFGAGPFNPLTGPLQAIFGALNPELQGLQSIQALLQPGAFTPQTLNPAEQGRANFQGGGQALPGPDPQAVAQAIQALLGLTGGSV